MINFDLNKKFTLGILFYFVECGTIFKKKRIFIDLWKMTTIGLNSRKLTQIEFLLKIQLEKSKIGKV